jgi:hypothetical protein
MIQKCLSWMSRFFIMFPTWVVIINRVSRNQTDWLNENNMGSVGSLNMRCVCQGNQNPYNMNSNKITNALEFCHNIILIWWFCIQVGSYTQELYRNKFELSRYKDCNPIPPGIEIEPSIVFPRGPFASCAVEWNTQLALKNKRKLIAI